MVEDVADHSDDVEPTTDSDTEPPSPEPAPVGRRPLLILTVVPVVAAAVSVALTWRFTAPVGDAAWLTQRVADAAQGRWPLVGMPSSIGRGAVTAHHPGPIQFYWLAPWWAVGGFHGIVIGTAVASAAALTTLGALTRRLPGATLLSACGAQVAAAIGLLTISTELLADPWNPYAAMPWLLVLVAAAVAIWSGHRNAWWAVVVAGSIVAQLHVAYLPVVVAVLVVSAWRAWRSVDARPDVRQLGALLVVGLLLWAPVVWDLIGGDRNPVQLARAVGAGGSVAGPGPVVVAAAAALAPWHRVIDSPWIPAHATVREWLAVLAFAALAVASWWFGDRSHWSRSWTAAFGLTTLGWAALSTRALPYLGLTATAYAKPLWPLAACCWFGIGAVWWNRRPERLADAIWIPVAVMAIWAVTVPRGYAGVDPAIRVRARELAEQLGDDVPGRTNVSADGFIAGWWLAPTLTAELDRRGVTSGIGTGEWDIADMTTRPRPLEGERCTLRLGEPAPTGRVLVPRQGLSEAESARLASLERQLTTEFPTIEPSRTASEQGAARGTNLIPAEPAGDVIRSGRFADLVVDGLVEGASLRDARVQEYVELAHRRADPWANLSVSATGC